MYYDSLWEYAKEGEPSYTWTAYRKDGKYVALVEIDVLSGHDLSIGDEEVEKDGEVYRKINWGELEDNYINIKEIRKRPTFWAVAKWGRKGYLISNGPLYQTLEKALAEIETDYPKEEVQIVRQN